MGFLKRQWIWLKRFRHRKGYGVHSPFAFNFLTSVVYEHGEYYVYRELDERFGKNGRGINSHEMKCRKFLFRLANYVHPEIIGLYGTVPSDVSAYLASGCCSATVVTERQNLMREADSAKLLYIAEYVVPSEWEEIVGQPMSALSVAVICGIHDSKKASQAWENVKRLAQVGVTFDLYDYGILFYDLKKQKQHYIVNF